MGAYLKIASLVLVSSAGSFVAGASYGRISSPPGVETPAVQGLEGTSAAQAPQAVAGSVLTQPAGAVVSGRNRSARFSDLVGFQPTDAVGQANLPASGETAESTASLPVTRTSPVPAMASGFGDDSSPFGP